MSLFPRRQCPWLRFRTQQARSFNHGGHNKGTGLNRPVTDLHFQQTPTQQDPSCRSCCPALPIQCTRGPLA
eukprot:scaffold55043_cov17-Tisochrysis_lutea.AAC.1